jgi:acetate---CoA ligase (ADP-forming) subunit beta
MKPEVKEIIDSSVKSGWVLEPRAKELIKSYGLATSKFVWAKTLENALQGAKKVGYPLVAKIVSEKIIHKSDVGGVVVGVRDNNQMVEVFEKFSKLEGFDGVLLDEMLAGSEVIFGSKYDAQFGIVVLVGIGGTSVEIYKDVALRMAPVSKDDAAEAINSLKGIKLLKGYRGKEVVNIDKLAAAVVKFSEMAYDLRNEVESMDLNPVMCTKDKAVVADARIILKKY